MGVHAVSCRFSNRMDENSRVYEWSNGLPIALKRVNFVFTIILEDRNDPKASNEWLLNLRVLAHEWASLGAQYNPKRFSALVIRWHYPVRIACLFFPQGKVVCTGAKSREQANFMISHMIERIRAIPRYSNVTMVSMKIENQVASVALPWEMNLSELRDAYSSFCNYDPESFPGAIVRHPELHKENSITCLVFTSGKMVIMGMKNPGEAYQALDIVPPMIKRFGYNFQSAEGTAPAVPHPVEPKLERPLDVDFMTINQLARMQREKRKRMEESAHLNFIDRKKVKAEPMPAPAPEPLPVKAEPVEQKPAAPEPLMAQLSSLMKKKPSVRSSADEGHTTEMVTQFYYTQTKTENEKKG